MVKKRYFSEPQLAWLKGQMTKCIFFGKTTLHRKMQEDEHAFIIEGNQEVIDSFAEQVNLHPNCEAQKIVRRNIDGNTYLMVIATIIGPIAQAVIAELMKRSKEGKIKKIKIIKERKNFSIEIENPTSEDIKNAMEKLKNND